MSEKADATYFDLDLVRSKLNSIDWNFPSAGNVSPIHYFPRYPGNFIYQIPSYLIQILSSPGEIVFDPFCGSGTTGLEASKLGRQAVLLDALQVSCEISLNKSLIISKEICRKDFEKVLNNFVWKQLCLTDNLGYNSEGGDQNLSKWYSAQTLKSLRYIWKIIEESGEPINYAMRIAFYETLVACASTKRAKTKSGGSRRHHWGWIADNVIPKELIEHDAISLFINYLKILVDSIDVNLFHDKIKVLKHDISSPIPNSLILKNSVDLIVTSPPYLGVIDYTKAHRLQYMWMGWDFDSDKLLEIGARCRRNRKDVVDNYMESLGKSFKNAFDVLKPNRFCAVVVGESSKFPGLTNDVFEMICTFGELVWGPISRTASRRRLSSKSNPTPVEKICVFQKK